MGFAVSGEDCSGLGSVSTLLADPGEARGCSINSLVIHSLIKSLSDPLLPTALRRRHAQAVGDRSSSYKIDYVIVIKNFLNPKGHQNRISGSKDTAILLKGLILRIGGASAGEGLRLQPVQQACFTSSSISSNSVLKSAATAEMILPMLK